MAKNTNFTYGPSFTTPEFRIAFQHLFKPDAFGGDDPKYSLTAVMSAERTAVLRERMEGAGELRWGKDRAKWPANVRKMDFATHLSAQAKDGFPIRDGDDVEYAGFAGHQYIKIKTSKAPGVVDIDRQPILDESEAHAGVIAVARVDPYAFDLPSGSGVGLALKHVMIVKDDGTYWGGGSRMTAEEAFNDYHSDGSDDPSSYSKTGTDDGADL